MAAPTGLKESLREISALMGLLRSDLIELSEAPLRSGGPATVVSHMHWIADRFDELGPALSTELARRSSQPGKSTDRRHASPNRAQPAGKAKPSRAHREAPVAARPKRDRPHKDAPVVNAAEPDRPDAADTGPAETIGRDES